MRDERNGLDRLLALARRAKGEPSRLQEGFETRLLARIREERERKASWFQWAWQLAPVFLAIVMFLGVWNYVARPVPPADLHSAIAGGGEEEQLLRLWEGE